MEQAVFTTLCMVCGEKGRVLVQERQGTAWDGIAFPGGHVEPGESFVESVMREVLEETGYRIASPVLCGIKQFQLDSGTRYVILLYKTNRFEGELRPSPEGNVFWVERSKIDQYPLAHDMREMLPIFDDDTKSEFYYLPEKKDGSYKIL